jgi:hypothetical protein
LETLATAAQQIDVHQHLWPEPFLEALRARRDPPRLQGWTLMLDGSPPYAVDPRHHDPAVRAVEAAGDGLDRVLVAASAVLGVSDLSPDEASDLAAAWHGGALALGDPFEPWATAGLIEPDPAALAAALAAGCVGLEIPATAFATPAAVEELGALLETLERAHRPLLVHPGPPHSEAPRGTPGWWDPVVGYVGQLHAAWWAWWEAGPGSFPDLQVCFCALAGLAPLHGERHRARGGDDRAVDHRVFLETSCYGTRAVDATVRTLGVDVICNGSDRPYAEPIDHALGEPATHAFRVVNPARLVAQRVPVAAAPLPLGAVRP